MICQSTKEILFSRLKGKKQERFNTREKERERERYHRPSLCSWKQNSRGKKNTRPIDCDCLTYLPQPLDSFFLFSPLFPSLLPAQAWYHRTFPLKDRAISAGSAVNRDLAIYLCAFSLTNARNCIKKGESYFNDSFPSFFGLSIADDYNFSILQILITINVVFKHYISYFEFLREFLILQIVCTYIYIYIYIYIYMYIMYIYIYIYI